MLTLTEKSTITNPDYVFKFVCDLTQEEVIFTAPDTSTNTTRFNQFTITESGTPDLYNGTITLNNAGFWSYKIYETTGSPLDISTTSGLNEVESGKVKVIEDQTWFNEFDEDLTFTSYNEDI